MNHVLIVDPSLLASLSLAGKIKKELSLDVSTSNSLKQTIQLLEKEEIINVAIVEPSLADDAKADVIDLLLDYHIPVIIYTSMTKHNLLENIINKPIVDYVIKSSRDNSIIVINLINHILRHRQTKILITDASATSRIEISEALNSLKLYTIETNSVQETLEKIKEHPEIKLVLTNDIMQDHNGLDLIREIRKNHSNKEVSIIGYSAHSNTITSADFLKHGANDFIRKPFQKEELINRVLIQLDMIDHIATIRDASEKDFLTAIYNRKYVYEVGRKLFDNAKQGNISLACAMIDIDHFKRVNDTYGHDIGDQVIIRLAQELSAAFSTSDIVGRIGGEEFCVILSNPDLSNLESIFEDLRKKIERIIIRGEDKQKNKFTFSFTISIGVTSTLAESFEEMLKFSDMKLYEAKNYGRNMVVI